MADKTKETTASKKSTSAATKKAATRKATQKKAAAKSRGKNPNKTAFILSFPESVKPQEIVEKAKAEGLKLDASYASTVRSKAKSTGTWPSSGSAGSTRARSSSSADTDFYRALKRVGVARAKELIANIEAFQNA